MFKNILLTVDLNQESSWAKALPAALEICKAFGARLHVMTVVPDLGLPIVAGYFPKDFEAKAVDLAGEQLREFVDKRIDADVVGSVVVAKGTIYEEILGTAKNLKADLIVMASHRPELQDYLIGPNAARVARHFPHSVMIVRD